MLNIPSRVPSKSSISLGILNSSRKNSISNSLLKSCSPKFLSPINKVKQDLSIILKNITSSNSNFTKSIETCRALDICANEPGLYQKEMQIFSSIIKSSIFSSKSSIPSEILENIYENHTETILDNSEIPYFFIAESAIEILENSKKKLKKLKAKNSIKKKGNQ